MVKEMKIGLLEPEMEAEMARLCCTAPGKSLWAVGHSMLCFGLWMDSGSTLGEINALGLRGFGLIVDEVLKSEDAKVMDSEIGAKRQLQEAKRLPRLMMQKWPIHMWNSRITQGLTGVDDKGKDLDKCCEVISELLLLHRWKQTPPMKFDRVYMRALWCGVVTEKR
jgi:hypothetical protein